MSIHRPLIIAALPTVFGGASDALEAALRFECAREDLHSYEVRLQKDGCAVAVYSEGPRWQEGFLCEAAATLKVEGEPDRHFETYAEAHGAACLGGVPFEIVNYLDPQPADPPRRLEDAR